MEQWRISALGSFLDEVTSQTSLKEIMTLMTHTVDGQENVPVYAQSIACTMVRDKKENGTKLIKF